MVAVDVRQHRRLWEYDEKGSFTDVPPAISDSGIVVITAMNSRFRLTPEEKQRWPGVKQNLHFIYGFDGRTGKLLWS